MNALVLLIVLNSDPGPLSGSWLVTTMDTCQAVKIDLLKEYEHVFCVKPEDLKSEILKF